MGVGEEERHAFSHDIESPPGALLLPFLHPSGTDLYRTTHLNKVRQTSFNKLAWEGTNALNGITLFVRTTWRKPRWTRVAQCYSGPFHLPFILPIKTRGPFVLLGNKGIGADAILKKSLSLKNSPARPNHPQLPPDRKVHTCGPGSLKKANPLPLTKNPRSNAARPMVTVSPLRGPAHLWSWSRSSSLVSLKQRASQTGLQLAWGGEGPGPRAVGCDWWPCRLCHHCSQCKHAGPHQWRSQAYGPHGGGHPLSHWLEEVPLENSKSSQPWQSLRLEMAHWKKFHCNPPKLNR